MVQENEIDFVAAVGNIRITKEAADKIADSVWISHYNQDVYTLLQQALEAAWKHEAEYIVSKYQGMDKSLIDEFAHNVNSSKHSPVLLDGQSCSSEQ
ncbi:MAG: hypothetical protein LBJ91_02590 [Clostridiales Family XIII bacterium]|jgi:hypothetical protein|nr:hypothetical protein [Clostridiales Family XIII bacterium]